MITTKHFAWVLLPSIALLGACQSEHLAQPMDEKTPITFDASTAVRVHGTNWDAADSVGVNVFHSTTVAPLGQNAAYVTPGTGTFSPAATPLYYPQNGDGVSVTAYYPYSATAVQGGNYHIDLVRGVNTDLLFAKSTTAWSKATGRGALNFTRQLSAIDFTITTNIAITTAPTVTIAGLPTQATLHLATGTLTATAGSEATYTRTATGSATAWTVRVPVLPGVDASRAQVTFAIDTVRRTVALPAGTAFVAGSVQPITVPITGLKATTPPPPPPAPAPAYESYFETPTITAQQLSDNRYVVHNFSGKNERSFALLYSPELRIAYWVAYPLTANNVGSGDRTDNWGYDPKIPQNEQPDLSRAYNGNYSRGHQIASADRLTTNADNTKTFYYTNMTPQNQQLNGGPWAQLEQKVRGWRTGTDTLYVVTGAMPTTPESQSIDYTTDRRGNKVAIPKYYFKALAKRVGGKVETIAFVYNHTSNENKDHMSHAVSVSALEKKTGFTFFPQLTATEKATYTASQWR